MAGAEAAVLRSPALLCVLMLLGLQRPVSGRALRFVNLIYRHGDRSPMQAYPADPYTENDWPQGFAQLTQFLCYYFGGFVLDPAHKFNCKESTSAPLFRSLRRFGITFKTSTNSPQTARRTGAELDLTVWNPTNPELAFWEGTPEWWTFSKDNPVGMKQHYALGQYLRHRYNTFLNSSYDRHEVYVQSTDIDRTLMSAQVNLAGLYPPQGHQIFHPDFKWQPIPVHTVPVEQDKFLKFPRKNCPRYQKLLEETLNSREVRKKIQKNMDFLNMVSNNTKMKVTMQNVWKVYDTLFCEKTHNFTLPSWATHEVITHMGELNGFGMEILFQLHQTQEKLRLQGGVLLKRILQNINQAINESTPMPSLKLIMYSAHDLTLIALQMALNVYNYINPPYASCFMFELYEEDDRSFTLDMYFRNQSDSEPHLLILPNCSEHCPLQDFIRITKHLIADNWEEECKISRDSNQTGLVLGVALSVCFVLLIVLGITLYWRWNWKTSRRQVPTSSDELA